MSALAFVGFLLVGFADQAGADDPAPCDSFCQLQTSIGDGFSGLSSVFSSVGGGISDAVGGIGGAITGPIKDAVLAVVTPVVDGMKAMLKDLFVPPDGFDMLTDAVQDALTKTPLNYLSAFATWFAKFPSAVSSGLGSSCSVPSGTATADASALSLCNMLGRAAGAGDWSPVLILMRAALWGTWGLIGFRSVTRLLANS